MSKLSPTHVEGVVSKWLVSEGDAVEACDLVAHLDADDVYDGSDLTGRVTMLLETHDDGVALAHQPLGHDAFDVRRAELGHVADDRGEAGATTQRFSQTAPCHASHTARYPHAADRK